MPKPSCGCQVIYDPEHGTFVKVYDYGYEFRIIQCPKHLAVDGMVKTLEKIGELAKSDGNQTIYYMTQFALQAAEGK